MRARVALFAFSLLPAAFLACQGTPDLTFDGTDASSIDATLPDGRVPPGNDGSGGNVDGANDTGPGTDSNPSDDGGGTDTSPPDDAGLDTNAPDTTPEDTGAIDASQCGLDGSLLNASCCGTEICIGVACQHCSACPSCPASQYCCGKENGAGKWTSNQCAPNPLDPNKCPLQ